MAGDKVDEVVSLAATEGKRAIASIATSIGLTWHAGGLVARLNAV